MPMAPPTKRPGNAEDLGDMAAFGLLFFAGIEQHDDEDEKHHDGAGVDDHLHDGDELGAEQQVDESQRAHDDNERERAVDGLPLNQQIDRATYTERREKQKEKEMHQFSIPAIMPGSPRRKR